MHIPVGSLDTDLKTGLGTADIHIQRIFTSKAGLTIAFRPPDRPHHPVQRQVLQAVGANMCTDLSHTTLMSDQILICSHIHAHKAGVGDRRACDRQVYLRSSGLPQKFYKRTHRIAAHDQIVHQ